MGTLTLEQLGKYEAHYVKKNGGIGALESLLGGIDNNNETEEIRSIAYSMYEEFHSDHKKRIIRNITIVSTVTMSAAFGVFLLIRHLNPIVDIKLPIEVVSLTLAAMCLLMLCYQLIKYESIEYRFDNRCSNEQDETSMIQANDSNDIVTLKTRLKRLTDCVKLNYMSSYCYDNPHMVGDNMKSIPKAPPMPNNSEKPPTVITGYKDKTKDDVKLQEVLVPLPMQSSSQKSQVAEMSYEDELKAAVEIQAAKNKQNWPEYTGMLEQGIMTGQQNQHVDDDSFLPPPPSPCDGSKGESASTWTIGIGKSILNGDRDR
ncbi:MAG: hypothetical protein sL5_09930 [Candidatus Mesenet longicola]|uniref:Uncharacterized protein n=1 Tax=Candidatus Mesenet longicola TaxID=1892558 RepID=A0A8J3HVN8_9RICK|nr:MAG: hypothetical protein sGL2_10570 [Candidatus Mesenet longicola]GHM60000.1 MAG: hypothetical protein sL5_09930 [Candidatus Mesenet longicola]